MSRTVTENLVKLYGVALGGGIGEGKPGSEA